MTPSQPMRSIAFRNLALWRVSRLLAVACWLAGPHAATASDVDPDQALVERVPAEAAVVLIVKSGEDLRDDVYAFARSAGIERDTVDWDGINPLGLSEQFEGRRGLAFFRRAPEAGQFGEGREHGKWAGLIPVANAQQALENLNAEPTGNGLFAFSVRRRDVPDPLIEDDESGESADIDGQSEPATPADQDEQPRRQNGQAAGQADRVRLVAAVAQPDLLAVARESDVLRWFLANREGPGLFGTWQVDQRRLFAQSDLFFSVNIATFRPALLDQLEQKLAESRENQPQNRDAGDAGRTRQQMTRLAQSVADQFKAAVEQTEAIYGGATIESESIRATLQIAFEPASAFYEELATVRPDSGELLAGLPDHSFLVAMSLDARPIEPLIARIAEQVGAFVRAFVPQNEAARAQIDKQVDAVKRMKGLESLFDFTSDGPLILERAYFDDAQAVFDQVVSGLKGNEGLVGLFFPNTKLVQKETTIDGVKVVEFHLESTGQPDGRRQDDEPRAPAGAAAQLLQNVTIQAAVVDDSIVEAIGPQENPIRLVLKRGPGRDGPSLRSRQGVQTTLDALPNEELFAVLLIDPARIAQAFSEQMARVFTQGQQQEQQLQRIRQRFASVEAAPPIGFGASTDGPGLTFSAVVLAESVKPLASMRSGAAADAGVEQPQPRARPATRN